MTDLDVAIRFFKENGEQADVWTHFHFVLRTVAYSYALTIRKDTWEFYARNIIKHNEGIFQGKTHEDFTNTLRDSELLKDFRTIIFRLGRIYFIDEIRDQL